MVSVKHINRNVD